MIWIPVLSLLILVLLLNLCSYKVGYYKGKLDEAAWWERMPQAPPPPFLTAPPPPTEQEPKASLRASGRS